MIVLKVYLYKKKDYIKYHDYFQIRLIDVNNQWRNFYNSYSENKEDLYLIMKFFFKYIQEKSKKWTDNKIIIDY